MGSGEKERAKLYGPEIPRELAYLWEWFMELERTRTVTEAGLEAIGYAEILAWATLTDRVIRPHEVEALVILDLATRFPSKD